MEKTVLYENIDRLVQYGLTTGLISEEEEIYTRNQLLEVFGEEDYQENDKTGKEVRTEELEDILKNLLDYAAEAGILKENSTVYRDLFDTRLMNCLLPRPSQVSGKFWELYKKSPEEATNYYYKFAQDSDYIRRYRIARELSQVPALQGKHGIYGSGKPSGQTESPDHSAENQSGRLVFPVFSLCVL